MIFNNRNIFWSQICIVLGAVLGTIIYRISLISVFYGGGFFLKKHAKIFTLMTAALINLIIIMILTRIYHRIARWMTNLENPRTQTEYENSFTFKIFVFEFVNFYSSLIYIAFFKVNQIDKTNKIIRFEMKFELFKLRDWFRFVFRDDFTFTQATKTLDNLNFFGSRLTCATQQVACPKCASNWRSLWSANSALTISWNFFYPNFETGGAKRLRKKPPRTSPDRTPLGKRIISFRILADWLFLMNILKWVNFAF